MKAKLPQNFITLDPGVEFGWAVWDFDRSAPVATGIYVPNKSFEWLERTKMAAAELREILDTYDAKRVVCESPSFFQSDGGQVSAKSGALVKLAFVVGRFAQVSAERFCGFELVEVNEWKGQMPKTAVQLRIKKRLGVEACSGFKSHAWDAVGIGLHVKGVF